MIVGVRVDLILPRPCQGNIKLPFIGVEFGNSIVLKRKFFTLRVARENFTRKSSTEILAFSEIFLGYF
jgi:hypothetical protein